MMGFIRTGIAFLLASVVGAVLVSAIATQINLAALAGVGAEISTAVRFEATLRDLSTFGPVIGPIMLIGYAIAFWVASLVIARAPGLRSFGYGLAGFVTVIVVMFAIKAYYALVFQSGITPVPASRTLVGLLLMAAGGAMGGLTFSALAARR
jgi:hypothetical protein